MVLSEDRIPSGNLIYHSCFSNGDWESKRNVQFICGPLISNFDPLNPFRMLGVFSMAISPRPTGRSGSQLAPEGWKQLEMVASRQLICQLSESFVVMLTVMDSSPVFFHLQKLFLVAPICELFEFNQFSSVMLPWQDMLQLYGRRQCRLGLVTGCKKTALMDWLIDLLTYWAIDWSIDWLVDSFIDGS